MAEEKTKRIGDGNPVTAPVATDKTVRLDLSSQVIDATSTQKTASTTKGLNSQKVISAIGSSYAIRGKQFKVIRNLSATSGEAQVFLVENEGVQYVLKLYYPNYKPKEELLKIIWNMQFEMIVKLYDYGTITFDGAERAFELMEYLEGGTLASFKLEKDEATFMKIALAASAALAYCHNSNIIHKDVKPGNFFFRDLEHRQLVLGDFGISSLFENDGYSHRTTQSRTPLYAAPEMYMDVIDGEVEITPGADYYSLGITLLNLWLGANPFSKNERVMMRMKNEGKLPELDKLPDRVRDVVRGLTCAKPDKRWTYNEVERWYKGEKVPIDESSLYLRYKTFVVDPERNLIAQDVKELAPLLNDNRMLGIRYLYSKRISRWLEECGNSKMVVELDDIVERRYPTDQTSGLMAAIYVLDKDYPYYDIHHHACHNVQDVAVSVLNEPEIYGERLKDPNDSLYIYLEAHLNIDRIKMSEIFKSLSPRLAVSIFVYQINENMPFLGTLPSSTPTEIVQSFGTGKCTDDQWRSLIDGRLLAWLSHSEDKVQSEAVRLLTEGKDFSIDLAYTVLYTIDRQCAFDLQNAFTREDVAQLLLEKLHENQDADIETFEQNLADFISLEGRLHQYASIHAWTDVMSLQSRILSLNSRENRERLGVYDVKIAAYKLCAALGVAPTYCLDGEQGESVAEVSSVEELEKQDIRKVRRAMRQGSMKAWLTLFFHENPFETFSEEYSYERTLEKYLQTVGKYEPSDSYFKRLEIAKQQTKSTLESSKKKWASSMNFERFLKLLLMSSAAVLVFFLFFYGINHKDVFMEYIWFSIWLPMALPSMVIGGLRGFFSGHGATIVILSMLLGLVSPVIPVYMLKLTYNVMPSMLVPMMAIITVLYLLLALYWGKRSSTRHLKDLKSAFTQDINTELLEPLYYTFKSKTFKFKSSKFGLMEDIQTEITSTRSEMTLHYLSWLGLFIIMIAVFVLYHPSMMDRWLPNTDSWINSLHDWVNQILDVR